MVLMTASDKVSAVKHKARSKLQFRGVGLYGVSLRGRFISAHPLFFAAELTLTLFASIFHRIHPHPNLRFDAKYPR